MLLNFIKDYPTTNNSKRVANGNNIAKPFLQWVGGKREMISQYKIYIPKKYKTYYEPFLGGGAMYFYLKPNKAILGDNNLELIRAYVGLRSQPTKVIKLLENFKLRHSKNLFMATRSVDRKIDILKNLDSSEIAARMIYLNQTCFNGLYRVNKKGQFNVPLGSSLNRLICDKNTIIKDSQLLKNATIVCSDFIKLLTKAKAGDFVYFDPPYFPVSIYSDFTRYTKEKFYKEDQQRLKSEVDRLTKIGCYVMLSNSNCKFIKSLYSKYNIYSVLSSRNLNCKRDRRGKVTELLITNYKP